MKKAILLVAMLCIAALIIAAPDFSGTWVRNAEKSAAANPAPPGGGGGGGGGGRAGGGGGGRGGGMGEMTIKMTAADMTITRQGQNGPMDTVYKLDGKENTVNTGMGDLKYTAKWNGDVLVIAGTQSSQRGDSPYKIEYSMSADGKTLTTAQTRTTPNGEMVTKTIYDKK